MGWWVFVIAAQYSNGDAITRNLGSISQFEQDLVPNSDNTRLVFCQDTQEGVGIFFCDTAGGKPRCLCEQKEKAHSWKLFSMLGWSSDDSLFACVPLDDAVDFCFHRVRSIPFTRSKPCKQRLLWVFSVFFYPTAHKNAHTSS